MRSNKSRRMKKYGHGKSFRAFNRLASFTLETISVPFVRGLTYKIEEKMLRISLLICIRWRCHMWVFHPPKGCSNWSIFPPIGSKGAAREYIPNDCIIIGLWHRSDEIESIFAVDGPAARWTVLDFHVPDDDGSSRASAAIQRKIGRSKGHTNRSLHISHSASSRLYDLQVSFNPFRFYPKCLYWNFIRFHQSNACSMRRRSTRADISGPAFSENIQHEIRYYISKSGTDYSRRCECAHQITVRSIEKTVKIRSEFEESTHIAGHTRRIIQENKTCHHRFHIGGNVWARETAGRRQFDNDTRTHDQFDDSRNMRTSQRTGHGKVSSRRSLTVSL